MARLIDADALLRHKRKMSGADFGGEFWDEAVLASDIRNAPTVDAVEVVRCKDCKYQRKVWIGDKRYKFGGFLCVSCDRNDDIFASHTVDGDDNDFCSYGERKNEANE